MYFGGSSDVRGRNPQDKIRDLFGGETRLIDATLAGFRGAPFGEDLPDTHESIGILKTDRRYRVALPVLAGVVELDDLRVLSDRQLRRALAFHFTTFTEHARNRGRRLIQVNSTVSAEVLVQCTKAKMRAGTYDGTIGYELAVGEYVALASLVVLPVLRSFSVRCAQPEAMTMLNELFIAAFLHADRATFLALVAEIWTGRSRVRTSDGTDARRPVRSRYGRRARKALCGTDIEQLASTAGRRARPPAGDPTRCHVPTSHR